MGLTDAWLTALQALLPPGRAFTREPDAVLTKVLAAVAAMLGLTQEKLEALLREADPRVATTMLTDWERFLGLPDDCTPAGQQVPERQRAAYQRLVEEGGQSPAYFIALAALLGEAGVTITEFTTFTCDSDCNDALYSRADSFTWRVNVARVAADIRLMNCDSDCDSALQSFRPSDIECALRERKPAHTEVVFAYQA